MQQREIRKFSPIRKVRVWEQRKRLVSIKLKIPTHFYDLRTDDRKFWYNHPSAFSALCLPKFSQGTQCIISATLDFADIIPE